jgi:hypothetical protein
LVFFPAFLYGKYDCRHRKYMAEAAAMKVPGFAPRNRLWPKNLKTIGYGSGKSGVRRGNPH